ncbi:DeoR/GlpR family DNA-binding transcription regulator [Aneurinibacillus terranovensis]|uniref:DeoR/GlpR family DNA-binding transcription regulator n=1 Tax=Aneurinibacillus terranovensis TaxID=278991 RepID=UPI00040EADC6|nr:DeoR/GlpR family DNA-binding transcription regulator [Aneurinibacillus terranovensis]
MLRDERHQRIIDMLDSNRIVSVSEIKANLQVTDMTIRRDLKALEEKGLLTRVHGGAKGNKEYYSQELSHGEKQQMNIDEKRYIAQLAAARIEENDTVFLGPGTTNEFIYDYINVSQARIVTNSIPVFLRFMNDPRFELLIVGGRYREKTNAIVGTFANEMLQQIKVNKAFIGTNRIHEHHITNLNEEEGVLQKIILENASEKYILADHTKFAQEAFYIFYDVRNVDAIITDQLIDPEIKAFYEKITTVIN